MNDEQTPVSLEAKVSDKSLTWGSLTARTLSGYALFVVASHLFYPAYTETHWTTAQKVVGSLFGYLLEFLAIYITTVFVAVIIAKSSAKNRNKPLTPFLNGALIVTMAIACFMIYGGWYASNNSTNVKTTQPAPESVRETPSISIKPIKAYSTIQTAEGVTEADLDQAALSDLETWLVETMLQKGRNSYAEMGYNPKDFKPKVSANSVYVAAGGKKLAIIKINMDNSMRSVTIMGIKGDELHRVSCIRASNQDIPVWSGPCGDEINKTFGVSVQPKNT